MKKIYPFALTLFILLCNISPMLSHPESNKSTNTINRVKITGKVAFCGKSDVTPTLLQFKLRSKDTTLLKTTVAEDGSFVLGGNYEKGLYELCASHPDCVPLRIPIYIDSNFTTEVTLQFNYYTTRDTTVFFYYGSSHDSLSKNAVPVKGADNIWRVKVKSRSPEIFYQVKGDEITGRTHCPSSYDRIIPDAEGDMIGVISTKNSDSVTLEYRWQSHVPCEIVPPAKFSNNTLEYRNQAFSRVEKLMNELQELRNKSQIPQWIELSHRTLSMLTTSMSGEQDGYVVALLLKTYAEVAAIGWYTKQPNYDSLIVARANFHCQQYPGIWTIDRIGAFPVLAAIYTNELEVKKHLAIILAERTIGTDAKSEILSLVEEVYTYTNQSSMADYVKGILLSNYEGTMGFDNVMRRLKSNATDSNLIGKEMMKIRTMDIKNNPHTVSNVEYKGKYVLLDFWATWCKPCIEEMGNLAKVKSAFDTNRFEIVGISLDNDLKKLKAFLNKKNVPWDNYMIGEEVRDSIVNFYSAQAIPRTILISPQGVIVAAGSGLRGEQLQETLKAIVR